MYGTTPPTESRRRLVITEKFCYYPPPPPTESRRCLEIREKFCYYPPPPTESRRLPEIRENFCYYPPPPLNRDAVWRSEKISATTPPPTESRRPGTLHERGPLLRKILDLRLNGVVKFNILHSPIGARNFYFKIGSNPPCNTDTRMSYTTNDATNRCRILFLYATPMTFLITIWERYI